ncbi:MAG: type 1 periplasmic binding fold superfamily protein [Flavobacteriales bacterium]|nr:type 1 periplasmic binding fold superfamily protein [Flavobacteriales bacterium]
MPTKEDTNIKHHKTMRYTMPRKYTTMMLLSVMTLATFTGCKKDEDEAPVTPAAPTNETELITTVRLTFNTLNNTEYKYFTFIDLDGDGGNAPMITADTLSSDSIYLLSVEVLDESGTPVVDITQEIIDEGVDHQFFYEDSSGLLQLAYGDADANNLPIGQTMSCITGLAGSGTLKVTLRHQPDKTAPGVSNGDITNAGGDTDLEVVFPLVVD